MTALACVRLAVWEDIDVIFASQDSGLNPALEDIQANSDTHTEAISWHKPINRTTHWGR